MAYSNPYSSLHCNEEFDFDDENDEFDNDNGNHVNNSYDANEDSEEGKYNIRYKKYMYML